MSSYIVPGPEDDSGIPHESVGKLLLEAITKHPSNDLAVIDVKSGDSLTFKQLSQQSQSLAASLRLLNVKQDDVIGIASENSCKFPVVYLASLFLASPLHLMNPRSTEYEFKHFLNMTHPKLVFYTKTSEDNLMRAKTEVNFIQKMICLDDISDLTNKSEPFKIEENIDTGKQPAIICNSSGTTGLPKGAMLSHDNLRMHFVHARDTDVFYMEPRNVVPLAIPLFHIYGAQVMHTCIYSGGTLAIWDQFNPTLFLQTVQNYKVKQLYLVPTLINFLVENPLVGDYNLSSLEQINTGASCLNLEDIALLRTRFNLKMFCNSYGLTETAGGAIHGCNISNGSCGKPMTGNHVKIADLQSGRSLPANKHGEICVRGNIMTGYFNNVEKTNESIDSEGFLRTGDLGYYQEDGSIHVIGRIKEIIKYKSFQVSPVELENILMRHPGIQDVAIVGKPDRRFGELPTALVVKKDGATVTSREICEHLSQFVSEEKRLHGGVRFVAAIPRTALGKIERRKLLTLISE